MTDILDTSFFDPIAPYIRSMGPGKNYLEIELPIGLAIDVKEAQKYFLADVVITYQVGVKPSLKGTVKDTALFNYLVSKYYEKGAKFIS